MSELTHEKRSHWVAMALCALLAVIGGVAALYLDFAWKIPLLIVIFVCVIFAQLAIARMLEANRDLRRQVARLNEAVAADRSKDGAAKGAYSVDEEGQRRLHISRLE